jgi:parvulin-like peptidyl-prolyl isomerase
MNPLKKIIFMSPIKKILLTGGLIIVVISGLTISYLYSVNKINSALKKVYEIVSLPIVKMDGKTIVTTRQLFQDTNAVRKFYESSQQTDVRVDFSTNDGLVRLRMKERDVLNKLIEDKIVEMLAQSKGIIISDKDVDEAVETSLKKADSSYQKLAVNLKSNYGWTVSQFKEKVVKNQLYLEKLFKWYQEGVKNSNDYKRAREARNNILDDGSNFNEIVKKFSDGQSANQNGQISWIEESFIIPEVAEKLKSMKEGEISDIIVSPLGMHIIILDGRRVKEIENDKKARDKTVNLKNKEEFQLRQIFIRSTNFIDWLQKQKKKLQIKVLLREYEWDNNQAEIKFSNDKLEKKAKKIKIKSQGDPTVQ